MLRMGLGLPMWATVVMCTFVTYWYQWVVAKLVPNTIMMSPMDH